MILSLRGTFLKFKKIYTAFEGPLISGIKNITGLTRLRNLICAIFYKNKLIQWNLYF